MRKFSEQLNISPERKTELVSYFGEELGYDMFSEFSIHLENIIEKYNITENEKKLFFYFHGLMVGVFFKGKFKHRDNPTLDQIISIL